MAYDKVVDSSVLDAGLKQIADVIREKAGTSDNLAFPQAMADAIAAIEAGGGARFATGTFTIGDTDVAEMVVNHNLGLVPNFVFFMKSGLKTDKTTGTVFAVMSQWATPPDGYAYKGTDPRYCYQVARIHSTSNNNFKHYQKSNSALTSTALYYGVLDYTEETATFGDGNNAAMFPAGSTYNWICAVIATTNAEV